MQFLRKINIPYWVTHGVKWLPIGHIQGNALNDLRTVSNALSVFEFDGSEIALRRIAAAMTCREGHIRNFGYTLLEPDEVSRLGAVPKKRSAETADRFVNELHINLEEVSAQRVLAIAELVLRSKRTELIKSDVKNCVRESRQHRYLLEADIPADVQKYL